MHHFKLASFEDEDFIIRKRKKPKRDKPEGLKLILKVGSNSATSTPERPFDGNISGITIPDTADDNLNSPSSFQYDAFSNAHKKSKKKKRKKEKDHAKREKKKKHKKDKKRRYSKYSSQDDTRDMEIDAANDTIGLNVPPSSFNFSLSNDKKDVNGSKSKSEKTTLQRLLEYIHQLIEKKDTQQFFAWPVTDQIAPGYSLVISHPMDLNSMKRSIENNVYTSLPQYLADLQLMCRNAMVYNRSETIYYKAAKKLLHFGLKTASADKLRSTPHLLPLLAEISPESLGFDQDSSAPQSEDEEEIKTQAIEIADDEVRVKTEPNENENRLDNTAMSADEAEVELKSEEGLADEILLQAKNAAKDAAEKVAQKKSLTEMGFLRQKKDGTTTLAILVPNNGIDEKTKERPVSLGSLIGKLSHGSGSLQGFREDKRNFVKTVKPLYYGAFGSYAPSYDSTFANLTKEESQLLFQTYGDDTAVHYAESLLNFSKDCDYVTTMVDNLLDIMTGGDHRKTKKLLDERKRIREEEVAEEKKLKNLMDKKSSVTTVSITNEAGSTTQTVKSATVSPVSVNSAKSPILEEKLDLNTLKSLSELGIDTGFINYFEHKEKEEQKINEKLEQTRSLLERLHQSQYERLSAPLPAHLSHIQPIGEVEHQLAEKVTENLSNIIKKVPPGNVAPVTGIRKAMGVAPVPPQQQVQSNNFPSQISNNNFQVSNNIEPCSNFPSNQTLPQYQKVTCDEETLPSNNANLPPPPVTGFDFESELREFLESDSLSSFHLPEDSEDADKTIEQMLSAHS